MNSIEEEMKESKNVFPSNVNYNGFTKSPPLTQIIPVILFLYGLA